MIVIHVLLQVRVVMNKEPKHFMKMFGGRLLVFKVSKPNPVFTHICVDYTTYQCSCVYIIY